jgi:hypothetical protein
MIRQILSFWTEEKSLSAFLALIVIHIFIFAPLATDGQLFLSMMNGVVVSLFLLAGLLTITQGRLIRLLAASLVTASITVRWLTLLAPSHRLLIADSFLALCYAVCFTVVVLRMVYTNGPVSAHRVRGAIAAYLLLGFLFSAAYRLLNYMVPGSFVQALNQTLVQQGQDLADVFMYFSLVTLTTVGFGDITAAHPVARSLVTLEAVIGTLYPAILIARLVSLQIEQEKK